MGYLQELVEDIHAQRSHALQALAFYLAFRLFQPISHLLILFRNPFWIETWT